ncbi:MAG: ThuA domain-containing protein, partial [Planctomycetes bacterium]|nr:ThuA domain-containing protein [Planctomycetota bacterium]
EWEEFRKIIGGIHIPREFTVDGKKYGPSGSTDDQDIRVTVADRRHPITKGINDFSIHDETYHKYYTAPDVKVLLTTDHPKNEPPLAWVKQYGKSRVFYFMLGHGPSAWQNPNYPRILANGIRWVAGDRLAPSEKTQVAAILGVKELRGVAPEFAAVVRRISELGGQFGFDKTGNLVVVDLASNRVSVSDADLPLLLSLPHLTKLKLSGGGISDAGIRQISTLGGLTELSLLDAQVDNAGLEQLARLAGLRSLSIRRSPLLNDEGVPHLKRLSKLVSLGLLEVGITDHGVAELVKSLPQLRQIDLRGCAQVGDAGLEHLRGLKNLKVLRVGGYQVTDASLAIIKNIGTLRGLTIEDAAITDAGLALLVGLPLEEIGISRCYSITDEGFEHIKNFGNLRRLDIRGIPLSGSGLKYLGTMDKLTRVKLSETGVGDAAVTDLRGLKRLTHLCLRQTQITDASLPIIIGLTNLKYLDIGQTGVSDDGVKRLAKSLSKCKIVR